MKSFWHIGRATLAAGLLFGRSAHGLIAGVVFFSLAGILTAGETSNGVGSSSASEAKEYTLPGITVTGSEQWDFATAQPRDLIKRPVTESPGLETSISLVGRYEIEQLNAYSLIDAMKYIPGGWTESRGRKVKEFFSVRGQRYPYPEYTIDGVWFREFHETNYYFNASDIDRIEVVRSSSAMLLGAGGMTGMINIVPRTYMGMETNLDVIFGTHNLLRTYITHGNSGKNFSYAFGSGKMHYDGPDQMNAGENITNLYGRTSFKVTPELTFDLSAFAIYGSRELKLAEPPASDALQVRKDSFDPMRTYMFVSKIRYKPSDEASTEITMNYAQHRFDGHRQESPPDWPGKAWSASDWLEHDYEYGTRVIQSLKLTEENIIRFGGMFNHWESPTGKRYYVGRAGDLWTYSGVVVDEHNFGNLDVNFGYRASRTYVNKFGGFSIEGSETGLAKVDVQNEWEDPMHTATFGTSYELAKGLSLHGNYTWGQIASQPGMLNEDLEKPGTETRNKFDVGIRKRWENFGEAMLTGFYVLQNNAALISGPLKNPDNTDYQDADGNFYTVYENTDCDNYGVELDIRSRRLENGLQFFFNATAMQTRRQEDGKWYEDKEVPEFILGGGASYLLRDFEIALFSKHVSPYENDRFDGGAEGPAGLGGFDELNAKIAYSFGKEKQNDVFFRVDNIGDKKYATVVGYPDDGRRFVTGLNLGF